MGYGDEILATGLARDPASRGKRAAFGDGKRIVFGPWSEEMFRHNPHVARPGEERADDLEWIAHYKGKRLYNSPGQGRWIWNYDFKPVPGQMFFSDEELAAASRVGAGFILIEPNVPWQKSVAPNKDWGFERYSQVANALLQSGYRVCQFAHGKKRLPGVELLPAKDFRTALAILARARLALMPEGGLHHGAAAVGTKAVVIFGGFIPPAVTGYDIHTNLAAGGEACGRVTVCTHCRRSLDSISVERVLWSMEGRLRAE